MHENCAGETKRDKAANIEADEAYTRPLGGGLGHKCACQSADEGNVPHEQPSPPRPGKPAAAEAARASHRAQADTHAGETRSALNKTRARLETEQKRGRAAWQPSCCKSNAASSPGRDAPLWWCLCPVLALWANYAYL